jgi:hypothetical protein
MEDIQVTFKGNHIGTIEPKFSGFFVAYAIFGFHLNKYTFDDLESAKNWVIQEYERIIEKKITI